MKKITLFFVALLGISCLATQAQTTSMYLYTQGVSTNVKVSAISDNNRYYVGTFDGSSLLYDYQTGTLTQFDMQISGEDIYFADVDNNGVAVGARSNMPAIYSNGTFTYLSLSGQTGVSFGNAMSVSADGNIIVGVLADAEYVFKPAIWRNDSLSILPLPTLDVYGEATIGGVADRVNTDGTVITGRLYTHNGEENGIVWRYNAADSSYSYQYFGLGIMYNLDEDPTSSTFLTDHSLDLSSTCLSPNGRYVMSTDITGMAFMGVMSPIVFDLLAGDSTIYTGVSSALGISVSNDKLVTVAAPFFPNPRRDTYVYISGNSDTPLDFIDYIATEYGFTGWPSYLPSTGTLNVSGDGLHFFGFTTAETDYYSGNINLYICPTPATAIKDVTVGNNTEIENTLITDNIIKINGEVTNVRIFDTTGRLLMQVGNSNDINISSLSNGIYLVETTDNNNAIATTRVVKK